MDVNLCIDRLGLNRNSYRVNRNPPPNYITEWDENNPDSQPTDLELSTAWAEYEAEYVAQEYARKREAEYPSIAELTVALYDTDDKADIEAKRAAVKAKYPKPE